ncbi:MAG: hypothetical protein IJU13_02890 [Bacteroidales bacterium]|nr:hypothetical protein [Bacteroidales bacterium]
MGFVRLSESTLHPQVRDASSMLELLRYARLIPFFSNAIPGYSVEEHTLPEFWFTEEQLGPWDWKIDCVQSGEIAYGKFLWGGKAAFATVDVYKELLNYRRSLPRYAPTAEQQKVLDLMQEKGDVSITDIRGLLGVKKAAADALMAKLQMQTRAVTGDIIRVYRGEDLHYNGWQRSRFCTPEALFEEEADCPFPGFSACSLRSSLTPAESLDFLKETVRHLCPSATDKDLTRLLG